MSNDETKDVTDTLTETTPKPKKQRKAKTENVDEKTVTKASKAKSKPEPTDTTEADQSKVDDTASTSEDTEAVVNESVRTSNREPRKQKLFDIIRWRRLGRR